MLQCTWGAHYIADSAAKRSIVTLSGLWYGSPQCVPLTGRACRNATKVVVGTLSLPTLTPSDLMAL